MSEITATQKEAIEQLQIDRDANVRATERMRFLGKLLSDSHVDTEVSPSSVPQKRQKQSKALRSRVAPSH